MLYAKAADLYQDGTAPPKLPQSLDMSHHLNQLAKNRAPSPLKDIIRFMILPGMISLGGGLPHQSLFPFAELSAQVYPPDHVVNVEDPMRLPTDLVQLRVDKSAPAPALDLDTVMQYGISSSVPALRRFILELTQKICRPAFADWEILLTSSSTDGWNKVVGLLCEYGDYIITEEHTYPSAQALWIPMGCKSLPIKIDGHGIIPSALEHALATWDETHSGEKRPHVLYTVPVGHNPTGVTLTLERKRQIYDICVKYDIVIVEDDPYYFLQFSEYQLGHVNGVNHVDDQSIDDFVASLVPSFLSLDHQGRVIRLDTFSKTLAPGFRTGWAIANPLFIERLVRASEVTSQCPSGFSLAILSDLFAKWGQEGYLKWMSNLRQQYRIRRDWMVDALGTSFELVHAEASDVPGAEGLVACLRRDDGSRTPVFSFVPPTAGMFVWCRFYLGDNAIFRNLAADASVQDPEQAFMNQLWTALAEAKCLVTPGSYYTPHQGADKKTTSARGAEPMVGHHRLAYSMTSKEEMEEAIVRMERVMRGMW